MPSLRQSGNQNETDQTAITEQIIQLIQRTRKQLSKKTLLPDLFVNLYKDNGTLLVPQRFCFDHSHFNEFDSHTFFEVAIQICQSSLLQLGERYFQLHPGQFAIIPRDQVHRLGFEIDSSKPATMLWINIAGDMMRSGYTTYGKDNMQKIWGCDLIIPGGFIISEVLDELDEVTQPLVESGRLDVISIYLQFFFMQLERKLTFVGEETESSWNEQIANEVKHYIIHHLSSSLRLQELADEVSISSCHLSKIFKQATDQTISGYIQQVKMDKAIEYLLSGTLSISEIASLLGFYDQYHFSKAFKAYTGYAPTIYRNAMSAKLVNGHGYNEDA